MEDCTALFADDGALATAIEGYTRRDAQAEMAARVQTAIADRRHLILEAGTGVEQGCCFFQGRAPAAL